MQVKKPSPRLVYLELERVVCSAMRRTLLPPFQAQTPAVCIWSLLANLGYRDTQPSLANEYAGLNLRAAEHVFNVLGAYFNHVSSFPSSRNQRSGTQCDTKARAFVSRISKLHVSDPIHGAAHRDVRCRHCAKDGAFGGHPAPKDKSLHGKFALRRKHRTLCHISPSCQAWDLG